MGGYVGRWVAKLGRWMAKFMEMGGYVGRAPALLSGSSLGSNPDISQEYKMGKGVANTLYSILL